MEELKVVGKNVPRLDVIEKVTGKAKYSADFKLNGVLHAKILGSPYPHARIVSIDTSKAESLPGSAVNSRKNASSTKSLVLAMIFFA